MKNYLTGLCLFLILGGLNASISVTNGLTHEHIVSQNEMQTGLVEIMNIGKSVQRVLFYLSDFPADCKGEVFQPADTGSVVRTNSPWITLSASERMIAPGEKYTLKYEIKTPNKLLKGSFWSLLMIEEQPLIDTADTRIGVKISSNLRYAVQLITSFEDDESVKVSFENVELQFIENEKMLAVKLFNECNKMLKPIVKMEVYNEAGELILEERAKDRKLYPSQCRTYYIPSGNLEPGKYQAVLVADCGNRDLFGLTVNLNVDE